MEHHLILISVIILDIIFSLLHSFHRLECFYSDQKSIIIYWDWQFGDYLLFCTQIFVFWNFLKHERMILIKIDHEPMLTVSSTSHLHDKLLVSFGNAFKSESLIRRQWCNKWLYFCPERHISFLQLRTSTKSPNLYFFSFVWNDLKIFLQFFFKQHSPF